MRGSLFKRTTCADDTRNIAAMLGEVLQDGDVVTLVGNLGAGKTQFSQGVGRGLGLDCDIPSPTFNLVFEYHQGRIPLYHFDLYRLDDAAELEDIDFFALVDEDTSGASLIEWADKFPDEMPEDRLEITISYSDGEENERAIEAFAIGSRAQALLELWAQRLDSLELAGQ